MGCKNCSDVTVLTGEPGNGVQTVVDNGDGTFTFFFTDGSTFTTPDFNGSGGTPGAPGAAATISLDSPPALIGAPGTAPTVTNTGSSSAAVFQFTFPIGIGHDNTLFVDLNFGETAGVRERIDKPWNTINAAIAAAVAGDTVHIRTGSYTENITLKDDVNIYCEEGVIINGKITDGGNPVVSVVSGNGILQDTASSDQCIEITGNGSDVKIRLERITNTGSGIMQRADTSHSSKLIVETEILSGNIVNYFVTVGGNVDCTVIINQYAETGASTGGNPFYGVDARASQGAPDGFSGTLNFSCPKMTIGNGTDPVAGIALFIEASTTNTARVFFNVDQIINNYDQPTYDSVIGSQNNVVGTLNLNGNGKYLINVKDCYSKSRVGLMVGAGDAIGGNGQSGTPSTGITIFEGMIFSLKSAALRMCNLNDPQSKGRVIIKNSSLSRGIDPDATIALPDRDSVVIFGDSGLGTQPLGGSSTAFSYMYAEFINTQIVKITDNPTNVPANALDPANATTGPQGIICIQNVNTSISGIGSSISNVINFNGCNIISGGINSIGNNNTIAVVGYLQENVLVPIENTSAVPPIYDTSVYFNNTVSNVPLLATGNAGAIHERNEAGGFVEENGYIKTLNYLHIE
tara:strand:- start:453 stop:2348 length:1896 start_codon:yes stop_codon:yes gene_type:complete